MRNSCFKANVNQQIEQIHTITYPKKGIGLISFVSYLAESSCEVHEERGNYKMKTSCPQWNSKLLSARTN